ncbi:MAG: Nucleotide-binding protein [Verrucomicrobiales bacterium]|nr:Nucleotide-binding protein [Verrucomicrobiales bacterium]
MNQDLVVVDANIAFKALVSKRGDLRDRLNPLSSLKFQSPLFLFVELFKHKERLIRASHLSEQEVLEALHTIVSRLEFVNEANVPMGTWLEAHRLCKDIDEKDTPYIVLTLHSDGRLWTDDTVLKSGLSARVLTASTHPDFLFPSSPNPPSALL